MGRMGMPVKLVAVFVMMAALIVGGTTRALAQEGTPAAGVGAAGFPNHIHEGTCDDLNPQPLVPLADLQFMTDGAAAVGTPMATPVASVSGGADAVPVAVATTRVELALSDILAADHAINVHDPSDISNYVACGAIGGTPDAQGNLFIGLQEQNGSGYSGVAWLLDDGSGAGTIVTVFLSANDVSGDAAGAMGTPMATPVA